MHGIILVHKELGTRSLYIPSAHIRMHIHQRSDGVTLLNSFRTDGFWVTKWKSIPEGLRPVSMIPMQQYMEQTYIFGSVIEVPEHIKDFAVRSERDRKAAIDTIESILRRAVENGFKNGVKEFLEIIKTTDSTTSELPDEARIADEVLALLDSVPGGGFQ